ncbi:MAG: aspartate aminotransferase family protein [Pseudomonadota bacterium]
MITNTGNILPSSLDNYWMPFTANRQYKANPRLLEKSEGMYYTDVEGRQILDGTAGLWCCNAGHGRREIADAVAEQLIKLDYASSFQMGHPMAFELASRLAELSPDKLNKVFFTNSGSEAVESSLKIALAYHHANGQPGRTRFIGREMAYHGVGFGGISVGGILNNRKIFSQQLLPGVDHLPHTLDLERNAFSKGLPEYGADKADALEQIIKLHGAETIAAVIVEPMSGAGGVIPPPVGYLKRLREITQKHGILLIFDEVITAFGRLGYAFASQCWDVIPDMATTAKALTNGAVPMGAVIASEDIYKACMNGPEEVIEFFHGYTYSGHPVSAAAALATLDIYKNENLFNRVQQLAPIWETALHSLKDLPGIIDIRNIGLVAAIQFEMVPDAIGKRAFNVFTRCFSDGTLVRASGDLIMLSPPLIINEDQIDQLIKILKKAILDSADD